MEPKFSENKEMLQRHGQTQELTALSPGSRPRPTAVGDRLQQAGAGLGQMMFTA